MKKDEGRRMKMLGEILHEGIVKVVLSAPTGAAFEGREHTKVDVLRGAKLYQAAMYTKTQVFHKNLCFTELVRLLDELFGSCFTQLHAWCNEYEYSARITKKGKILSSRRKLKAPAECHTHSTDNFDKRKNYIIEEGTKIPALYDLGVFTQTGRVAAGMGDKFRQINRFVELIADEMKKVENGMVVNVIDFGCGKSYLTFVVYHYLTQIRGLRANICGLDLSAEVIEKCAAAALKYGNAGLEFKVGDIGSLNAPPIEAWGAANTLNIVICLHACDTATDDALNNAIKWNADLIYAVPCCHKELNGKIGAKELLPLTKHGVIKERFAALLTDAYRAEWLEQAGYKTQVLEFIDMDATPKNLLIRARRKH